MSIADLLFELLVNSVQSVFDSDSFQIPGRDFEPQREVKVNLLDRWCGQHFLQGIFVVNG